MKRIRIVSQTTENANIIDIYFVHEDAVEADTKRPDTYTEEFQRKFHDFCNDIYNFVKSLERKWLLRIDYEYKNKDGLHLEVGYRRMERGDTPQSYYIPFHVVTQKGRLVKRNNRFMQVRISTHDPKLRRDEVLLEIPIEGWMTKAFYEQDKRKAKAYIKAEVEHRIDEIRSNAE